ncbi:hypothetical protein C8R41DRAFT_914554 [Lentinula lateritia]|uniref:Uncharacterized protein n=1 Tax=Lentinula lateritia TaxID=40482 RepID=A0ABQ8VUN1_9AGAR|nr:hypothetical protein C8R41DRAFT_914554 [Lentinula lateritia]
MHNDNFASQASDTPIVHANPDPSDRVDGQLDPQEFSFGDRASYGHGAYQDVEYEEGSTDGNYPIFTKEEGHMESTGSGKEGVQDGKMAPYYYPRSHHVDIPGPVLTIASFSAGNPIPLQHPDHFPSSKDCTMALPDSDYYLGYAGVPSIILTMNSFSNDDTVPPQQPNHTPFDKAGAQDTGMPSDPSYYPGYADVPSPVVIVDTFSNGNIDPLPQPNYSQDYSQEQSMNTMPRLNGQPSLPVELARTSQGVHSSDNNLDNDIDTLQHVCTESSSYNNDPTPVNQSIQEKAMQKQEPADINVAMNVPLKDKADKAEADEDEKQGKQTPLQIEEEDTEDLGFPTLPPQFCNENISDPQADVPNSHIYPCDAASRSSIANHITVYEGEHGFNNTPMHDVTCDAFFDMLSSPPPSPDAPVVDHPHQPDVGEDSSVLLEGGFDHHGHDVTKDPGVDNNYQGFIDHHCAFCNHDAVNHPGSGAPSDLNQESQDSPHHTGLHGTDAGNEQGVSEDHHHPYQVNTIDKMQIDDGLYKSVNDNTGPEDFETPNPHVNTTLNL